MSLLRTFCIGIIVSLFWTLTVQAQPANQPLPEEAKKRLDHIIGRWTFKTDTLGRNGEVRRTVEGTEEAKYIIEGRVVELTTVVNGMVSKGWLFYNVAEKKFYLTSVDGRGDLWILSGGLDEYVITSQPKKQRNGRELTIRFTHDNIEEDSFEALYETSIDGGKSWWQRSRQYLTREKE